MLGWGLCPAGFSGQGRSHNFPLTGVQDRQTEPVNATRLHLAHWTCAESGIMEISVTSQEASLITAFRRLAPDAAGELSRLIERLGAVAPERKIDWSDSWSDEDLRDFRAASLRRLEESEAEGMLLLEFSKAR